MTIIFDQDLLFKIVSTLIIFGIFAGAVYMLRDEPIEYHCIIENEDLSLKYDACRSLCETIEWNFSPSVLMAPKFIYFCLQGER